MITDYGRTTSGDRVYSVAPYPHGQMITFIGAIIFKQVLKTMTINAPKQ
ncbi:MAG: hypothetical protein O4861_11005 [Trichodesmium sp. St16_bin4-tuft]|nr:hypothetical protein [Trichodesmium sp. MAG_R01]MDE5069351.1 hypothetical protein [Trichodesmium sp. St4_bin8_1]MDE5072732.1 hypothetical protein [Trichodesmium sp. St5_bin8]MDE5077831.1 hypothetical protein [Trichodesmium sp. St2_bin6]MDE5091487.1 hypothetical protein [Trichodesmium sp. St18_bin3_1_1]MDE5098831.1 hypothetical protein [Trichodesmium sp. St16_bin4-tuft]MDE5104583.1 hypothetical protein [Trichodesmium sp. St19_bin2]